VDKDAPTPGDTVNITVTARNEGPATAKTPIIHYQPPAGISNVEFTTDGKIWTPWPGNAPLPDIPNGGMQQIIVRGKVDGSATGVVTSTFTTTATNENLYSPGRTADAQINVTIQKICTVSYYCNNRIREVQKIICGSQAPRPADPGRFNSNFAGWFTAQRGKSVQWDFSQPVTGNMTLYARWMQRG
jgi:uncharacterized repeat protein (TIGR01451 family)/uncharacterized repeat protein (TIGR02543 family)